MKLYTEEQVRSAMYLSDNGDYNTYSKILNQFTPIELPSDEEIEEEFTIIDTTYPHMIAGAKWMKEQIFNQNNNNERTTTDNDRVY